jgi:hypothetical protein
MYSYQYKRQKLQIAYSRMKKIGSYYFLASNLLTFGLIIFEFPIMKIAVKVIASFLTILFCVQLCAQSKSLPGFYITQSGDTVKGVFSNYTQWSKNPDRVKFTASATLQPIVLTPINCLKFSIENYDEYVSYSGQRLENPIEDQELINGKESMSSDDQYSNIITFLRLFSKNSYCELYVFSDNKRVNLFYKLPGQPLSELKYKKYLDQNKINEVPEYKQQLNNFFSIEIMKRNLAKSLQELPYTEKGMIEFFEKLSPDEKPKYKSRNLPAGWLLSAGVSINLLNVKGDKSIDEVRKNYSSSISPLMSVGYILPLARNFNNYFFFPQVKLYSYKSTGQLNDGTFIRTTTFKSNLIVTCEINGGVYVVNKENFRVHLSGGTGFMWLPDNKQLNQSFAASNNTLYSSSQEHLSQITYIFNLSTGITIKKRILVLATYNFPAPVSKNYVYFTPMLRGIQFRVGYILN